jgi:membrane protein YqaA with SNARE-associated domain
MTDVALYGTLFLVAFASATLVPGQSEAVLVGLLLAGHPPWLLLAIASAGNVLGSVLNWILGRGLERFRDRRWFPVKPQMLNRAQGWYARYGKWSLLLSWAPVVGDPLTIVAGVMRERFGVFLLLVTVAKAGRYLVLVLATLQA